jgi:drug/metabolite transporter (DMT)-like permease
MGGVRWIVAGGLLIAFFRIRGERLPAKDQWLSLAVRGVLLIGLGNGAVVWAEQTLPSGLTAVLVAVSPVWMVGIDALIGGGKVPTIRQIVGLCVGFLGILLLVSPSTGMAVGGRGFWSGFIATQLACVGWAVGSSYARQRGQQQNDGHPLTIVAFEMLSGGIVLLGCGLMLGEKLSGVVTPRSAAAVVYLIVFGSIVAFSSYRYALQHLPIATLSLYVYANTVIAVFLGTLLLGEPFSWRMGMGAAVVLVGIALVKEQRG